MNSNNLKSLIDLSQVGSIPWPSKPPANQLGAQYFKYSQPTTSSSVQTRTFHYLKALNGLGTYADDFGFQWTNLYDDYRKDRYKHLDQFMRLGINPESLSGKVCLDVGCGLGRLSEICLGRATYVFGVDLSQAVLEAGRLITSDNFIPLQASADRLPIRDDSIDFVYSWGVLHHTQDPSRTLAELWRVVKPGGLLAFWVYPRNEWYLRRSLLANYFSGLSESEMYSFSDTLTSLSHTTQLSSPAFLEQICSDLCFSMKNTKEYTRHILYDGLGPSFHYLLDSQWFLAQSKNLEKLASIEAVDKPFTVARMQKSL